MDPDPKEPLENCVTPIGGALSQNIRFLRLQAAKAPISFSPPGSPILFSQNGEENSFLYETAHDLSISSAAENLAGGNSSDVAEITTNPPQPLMACNTPISQRLRVLAAPRSTSGHPTCNLCAKNDGRKGLIQCAHCEAFAVTAPQ